jgi:hypothetical protein
MNQFVRASSKKQTPPSIAPRRSSCQKQPRLSYDSSTAGVPQAKRERNARGTGRGFVMKIRAGVHRRDLSLRNGGLR